MNIPSPDFHLIPVLDLMDGKAVHAVGGDRAHYQPLTGRYAPSPAPDAVLGALESVLPRQVAYVADLDAIRMVGDNTALLAPALNRGWTVWLDTGLRDRPPPIRAGIVPIAGTETMESPAVLERLLADLERLVVSVDLRGGRPIRTQGSLWPEESAGALLQRVVGLGARTIIVLDLAVVGRSGGPAHLALAHACKQTNPQVEIYLGGGIRGPEDLHSCRQACLSGALVATALQAGALDACLTR